MAEGLIEAYAPNAPADTKDEAAIRLVGYLYEQAPTGVQSQNPIRHSGALPLLSPYASVAGASTRDAETA